MGIKEIYLLGIDNTYKGQAYFSKEYPTGDLDSNYHDPGTTMEIGYRFIHEKLGKRGVKIYNATRGGALEVFPRIDFDSLFDNRQE